MEQHTEVGYARNGNVHLAYRVLGSSPVDLLCYPGAPLLPMDSVDEEPHFRRLLERLCSFARVVQFDARGIGLSDPVSPAEPPTLEQWVDDAICVLDACGSDEAVLFAPRDSTLQAVMLATAHPARVSKLVIVNGFARFRRADDYPVGIPGDALDAFLESSIEGIPSAHAAGAVDFLTMGAPSVAADAAFRAWWDRRRATGGQSGDSKGDPGSGVCGRRAAITADGLGPHPHLAPS